MFSGRTIASQSIQFIYICITRTGKYMRGLSPSQLSKKRKGYGVRDGVRTGWGLVCEARCFPPRPAPFDRAAPRSVPLRSFPASNQLRPASPCFAPRSPALHTSPWPAMPSAHTPLHLTTPPPRPAMTAPLRPPDPPFFVHSVFLVDVIWCSSSFRCSMSSLLQLVGV